MKQRLIVISLTLCLAIPALRAQWSASYASEDAAYYEGVSLYQQGQYVAAQHKLEPYTDDFYYLACAFELRQPKANLLMEDFLKAHPYTPYASEIHYMDGVLLTEMGKYKKALRAFHEVKEDELFRPHRQSYLFYKGYAHVQMSEYKKAASTLAVLKAENGPYSVQARYYHAYAQYALGNYGKALPDFLSVEDNKQYASIAPYYIVQIYYAQKQYDEVLKRAQLLMEQNPGNPANMEMHRIVGEIYYQQGNYPSCVRHLQEYERLGRSEKKTLLREDMYLLGVSAYRMDNYQQAVDYLHQVKGMNDSITQSSQLHLAHAYRYLGDINKSKQAYATAMRYTFDDKAREEAMFNYALLTLQSSSALGEVLPAFQDFLREYPHSAHTTEVYRLTSEVYRSAKNYQQALRSLDAIEGPTSEMQLTKQYFRYKLGTDAFVNKQYTQAVQWFDEVLKNDADPLIHAQKEEVNYVREALYWKAESQYRLKQYNDALLSINRFMEHPDAQNSANYSLAKYLEGYVRFQQKEYAQSASAFQVFLKRADKEQATYTDALNRLGDCAFAQRDFVTAEGYYTRVISTSDHAVGIDYAMFQRGYTLGLLRRYGDKVTQMERLVTTYPRSDYADDALYEIARAEVQRDHTTEAIASYDRLLSTFPHSPLVRKAALEKAMLYYNVGDYASAIESYKRVIKNYPNTEEANSALEGLETCYVETNDVETYLTYCRSLGKIYVQNVSNEDSVSFAAAERQYLRNNYQEASPSLQLYMEKYCDGGRYCAIARYYLADSYYRLEQYQRALPEYRILAEMSGNPWQEEAVIRAAELSYDEKDYTAAMAYFRQLLTLSSSSEHTGVARLGILRTAVAINDYAATIDIASTIISDAISSADARQEARYFRMKANYHEGHLAPTMEDAVLLSQDVRTAWGAEAEYLRAQCQYDLHQLDAAEEEVMAFANMQTSQQYWLARAFLLLSDVYVAKGDDFQAEQFLLSLRQNYTIEDDIPSRIDERLRAIEEHNQPVNTEDDED